MARESLPARIAAQRERRVAAQRIRVRRSVLHRDGARCEVMGADGVPRWLLNFCARWATPTACKYCVYWPNKAK